MGPSSMCISFHFGGIYWTVSEPPKDLYVWKYISAETKILFASDRTVTVTLLIEALIFAGYRYPA